MGKLLRMCVWLLAGLSAAVILYVIAAVTYSRGIADYQAEIAGWPERSDFGDPLEWKTDDCRPLWHGSLDCRTNSNGSTPSQ